MNNKNKILAEKVLLNTIKKSSVYATREGCVKCWRGVTYEHFMTMAGVCWKLANQGWKIYTEVEFNNGGRGDIVAISGEIGYVIEILHTESEARFSAKEDVYPREFTMIPIKTQGFDIDTFEI